MSWLAERFGTLAQRPANEELAIWRQHVAARTVRCQCLRSATDAYESCLVDSSAPNESQRSVFSSEISSSGPTVPLSRTLDPRRHALFRLFESTHVEK